jgi:hypothetical protein
MYIIVIEYSLWSKWQRRPIHHRSLGNNDMSNGAI